MMGHIVGDVNVNKRDDGGGHCLRWGWSGMGRLCFVMGVACRMMGMGTASDRHLSSGVRRCGGRIVGDGNVMKGDDGGGCAVCDVDGAEWGS